ncbi:MAG TPA: hypothetical protein VNO79_16975 [Actinomycetota bacterium]|nr:hypothetical protein [Actinomycetota bacterium]
MAERGSANGNGITRRAFVRRTAVVGGSLLWIAPAIQTLAPAARAHVVSPASFFCCECRASGSGQPTRCTTTGIGSFTDCQNFCTPFGLVPELHTSPTELHCEGPSANFCSDH